MYEALKGTITIPTSDTVQVGTVTPVVRGQIAFMNVSVPALEGTGTATILGTDSIGGTILNSTAANESTIARVPVPGTPTYFDGTLTVTATANGTQSVARDVTYILYVKTKHG